MKSLTCQEIRIAWIKFFTENCPSAHKYFPSASLVPDNPTLLLNSAGMVQFVPIFMGTKPAPDPPRAVTVQKCARVGGKDSDLENIGRTTRHHSFFEMLGNFSFGDYFKAEAIEWAWRFVREDLGMEADRLYTSVFEGDKENAFDQEAYDIWDKVLAKDFPDAAEREKRIWKMSRKDNFWGPPGQTGPCGPCSEIYYDLGDHIENWDDRYVEIWNLVFMEFMKDEEGNFTPLEHKNIDTGAGLERIATILQGVNNSFETDELMQILNSIAQAVGLKYGDSEEHDLYLKIVTDHLRCLCFLIADGVRPSNLGRGYVLRMIIRRAARFLYLLRNKAGAELYQHCNLVAKIYAEPYPNLQSKAEEIAQVCKAEEEQFAKTIDKGLEILEAKMESIKDKTLAGDFVFDLYSTYGFPLELTRDIAEERGLSIDEEAYNQAREKHSQVSNVGSFNTSITANVHIPEILKKHGPSKFLGYENLEAQAQVIAILDQEANKVDELSLAEGKVATVILDQTPFYAESGGQVADRGTLTINGESFQVTDVRGIEGIVVHTIAGLGKLKVGAKVDAQVDIEHRRLTRYHHTSCHLLQAALRQTLGDQIQQMGSQVGPEYTRFDFNLDRAMTKDELKQVEDQVNAWIQAKLPVTTKVMEFDDAIAAGALSFFEEKYDDEVRVLFIGDEAQSASIELCGGTHVSNIADIEEVVIAQESSIAAGIRRIRMLANQVARDYIKEKAELDKAKAAEAAAQEKSRSEAKARKKSQTKEALAKVDEIASKAEAADQVQVLIVNLQEYFPGGLDGDIVKTLVEALMSKLESTGNAFVFCASAANDKAVFIAAASKDLIQDANSPYNASNAVKAAAQICGGGGGGRPNFAQAGGKDLGKVPEAINTIKSSLYVQK